MTRPGPIFAAICAAVALLLAGCGEAPEPATPALWQVSGPEGAHGYLFGTIHALDEGTEWRSPAIARAFADADTLVVEVAGIADREASAKVWRLLATTRGLPPLSRRVPQQDAATVRTALERIGLAEREFADTETWAAALTLADLANDEDGEGLDLQLLRERSGKRVAELEGVARQLSLFDRLPPAEQSDLLVAVARGMVSDPDGPQRLARLWRTGDIDAIAAETHKGMLADPELREALLVVRNRAWAERIDALLEGGSTPFVAVGAAHLAGSDGLPELLQAKGYKVRRIQ